VAVCKHPANRAYATPALNSGSSRARRLSLSSRVGRTSEAARIETNQTHLVPQRLFAPNAGKTPSAFLIPVQRRVHFKSAALRPGRHSGDGLDRRPGRCQLLRNRGAHTNLSQPPGPGRPDKRRRKTWKNISASRPLWHRNAPATRPATGLRSKHRALLSDDTVAFLSCSSFSNRRVRG